MALVVAAGMIAAMLWRSGQPDRSALSPPAAARPQALATPVDWSLPADLPALPLPKVPLPRAPATVRAAYEFAARHPEVLEQLPCFCGCRNLGHRSNHDCFVAGRGPGGRVAWTAHGMG